MAKNNANARIRRRVAEILFDRGPMTRSAVASILLGEGNFRVMPSDASLSAMLAKNIQIIQTGTTKVDVGDGTMTNNSVYAIDEEIIHCREDLLYTRPYSTMTKTQKSRAKRCPTCKQMRYMGDHEWDECLICQRRPLD
ncbi:MAG: hypothetical protein Tp1100DCM51572_48 [Prokaryotic dsDNA virus sp.]|nr:MAG: hypothetical protein Tp1100DCM51572_48 [Prokaryotic dsDNA virus sp.]